jgi:hypothetical protein
VVRAGRLLGVLLVLIAAGGLAVALGQGSRARHHTHLSAKGALRISNSLDGRAILTAPNLAPGEGAEGQVTVRNDGGLRGRFRLVQRITSERAGAGGGLLSQRLQLTIERVGGSPAPVYSGPIGGMRKTRLGRIAPRASRTYAFQVLLPEGGTADDAYQGASLTVDYRWKARAKGPRCKGRRASPRRKGCKQPRR